MRIGIDVGGTNTDAVLMDGPELKAWTKSSTTSNIGSGIKAALHAVLDHSGVSHAQISAVMIGTTHFTNAVVERKGLQEIAAIRLGLPASRAIKPYADWPDDLSRALGRHTYLLGGGHEFDGREIAPLGENALMAAIREIRTKGLTAAAVSSIFSPIQNEMEIRVRDILLNEMPGLNVTLSSEIGRIGLLERENAALLNASLSGLSLEVVESFKTALRDVGIAAPLYISQNDGTLMTPEYVARYPVLTFASGPTNSMRGAARLSGEENAIVVDIGGTTSDVGMLIGGFPREASVHCDIGGVRTNFRMPDILAVGLGGGSLVHDGGAQIGPRSLGYRLVEDALVFGGNSLTATDIVVAAGMADIGDRRKVAGLSKSTVSSALENIRTMIDQAVDRVKTGPVDVPVVLVGGGAILVTGELSSTSRIIRPEHATVANAIGAAIAQVGGEVDRIFSFEEFARDEAIAQAKQEAMQRAEGAGAKPGSVRVMDVEEVPLAYLPGSAARIRVKAVGDLTFM